MKIHIVSTQIKNGEHVIYTWLEVSHVGFDGVMLHVFLKSSSHVPSYARNEFISFSIEANP